MTKTDELTRPQSVDLVIMIHSAHDSREETIAEVEVKHGFKCTECEEFQEEGAGVPLYECNNCGTKFAGHEGHRCPDCNKFASKLAADVCSQCEEGEIEEADYLECPLCQETVAVEDLAQHISNGC